MAKFDTMFNRNKNINYAVAFRKEIPKMVAKTDEQGVIKEIIADPDGSMIKIYDDIQTAAEGIVSIENMNPDNKKELVYRDITNIPKDYSDLKKYINATEEVLNQAIADGIVQLDENGQYYIAADIKPTVLKPDEEEVNNEEPSE